MTLVMSVKAVAGLVVIAFLAVPGPCTAETLEDYYAMLEWRNVGPLRGGRSIAVAGSSQREHEYYFGATGGGLWKTTDGGTTWAPVTDGQIGSASVGAVAVDPTNPDVVYLGMGEGELRANVLQGDGMYKSVDGGRSWRHIGLRETKTIDTIRIDPRNPDVIYVAALGDPYAANEQRGIFRSHDGGESWEKVLYRSAEAGAIDLAMDPNNPEVLIATIWQVYRKPWKLWSGGPQSGIFKSTDGGDSWTEITRNPGLPGTVLGKITVAISGADSSRIYANIEAKDGGLYRSDDGGDTWEYINGDRKLWQRSFYFLQVRADPNDKDTVYVLSFMLEKSTDGGKTFVAIPTHHPDFHDLWIDPRNSDRMIVGDDGGASITVNGGATWTEQDYPTAQMYRVATTNDFPFHVCGTQQDRSDAVCVPSRVGASNVFAGGYTVGYSESGYVTPHPVKPGIFFSGATNALMRVDRTSGRNQDVQPFPYMVMGEAAEDMPERWNWTYPIVFAPKAPHALYVGSQHLWKSLDEGSTWEKISPDLTRADPATLQGTGGAIMLDQDGPEVYATIYSIAVSPRDGMVVWTGSDDGVIHVTRDGGRNWSNVTPGDLPMYAEVKFIEASAYETGRAYAVANRVKMGDRAPYVWKTDDFGATWTRLDASVPDGSFTHGIREDSEQAGLLYLGTEDGVLVSFDGGARWRSLSLNLPEVRVSSLQINGDSLAIATHGRSFYVLDGLSTLRQLARDGMPTTDALFRPGAGYRPSIPVQFDFFLEEDAADVRIEILDQSGEVVRRLETPVEPKAGAHRVVWDLRHDGATVFEGIILEGPSPSSGPMAVPGKYTVRLAAGGKVLQQDFQLMPAPNMPDVTPDDLSRQLELALRVRNATTVANETVIEIRAMCDEIESRIREADPDLKKVASRLLQQISAIEAELYQVRNRSPKDKIALPIKLNNRLSGLMAMLASADGAPTNGQYAVYEQLEGRLREILEDYRDIKSEDLGRLNELLEANGMHP